MIGDALSAAKKDLVRHREQPLAILIWLAVPLLIGGLMYLVAGAGSGPKPKALVVLTDEDDSFVSGLFLNAFKSDQFGAVFRIETMSLEEGRAVVDAGDATAQIVIPRGFSDSVLKETPAELTRRIQEHNVRAFFR